YDTCGFNIARNNTWHTFWTRVADGGGRHERKEGSIDANRWYSICVEARGPSFRALLDGQELLVGRSAKLVHGRVGLGAGFGTTRFRNIQVVAPDGAVLWKGPPNLAEAIRADQPARPFDADAQPAAESKPTGAREPSARSQPATKPPK